MESLEEKVTRVLRCRFGRSAKVKVKGDGNGIIGTVTSPLFRGLETINRIDMIWNTLEESLDAEEQEQVAIIMPMTPEEARGHEDQELV